MENFALSVDRFDEFASEYAQRFMDMSAYASSISLFCDLIEYNSPKILELACGPGNITQLIKSRFPESQITAIDLAPKMLEIAQKILPDVIFKLMDVRQISTISEKFDAIMCSFCLPFLSKNDSIKLLADCYDRLNTGGVIYISTMEGDESKAGFETTSFTGDVPVYFNYHRFNSLVLAMETCGFKLLQKKLQEYHEPDGSLTQDMIFIGVKK